MDVYLYQATAINDPFCRWCPCFLCYIVTTLPSLWLLQLSQYNTFAVATHNFTNSTSLDGYPMTSLTTQVPFTEPVTVVNHNVTNSTSLEKHPMTSLATKVPFTESRTSMNHNVTNSTSLDKHPMTSLATQVPSDEPVDFGNRTIMENDTTFTNISVELASVTTPSNDANDTFIRNARDLSENVETVTMIGVDDITTQSGVLETTPLTTVLSRTSSGVLVSTHRNDTFEIVISLHLDHW